MDNQWSYLLFDTLIHKILNGKQSIQEPIQIYNPSRTQSRNISFLNHLLLYDNIHKDNILETISDIYDQFLYKMEGLKKNTNILNMINMVHDEWYKDYNQGSIISPVNGQYCTNYNKIKQDYNKSIDICEKCMGDSEREENVPYESILRGESPNDRGLDSSIILCNSLLQNIHQNIEDAKGIIESLHDFDTSIYTDLSIKHKPLYFELNGVEDDMIPENIHTIFSNFMHIHNLLYKQVVQQYNHLNTMKKHVIHMMENIKGRKTNKTIAESMLHNKVQKKTIPYKKGDKVMYKDNKIVVISDIDYNVPLGHDPIIYIQFEDGGERDTLLEYIKPLEDNSQDIIGSEEGVYNIEDDTDDEKDHFLYGGGDNTINGAKQVSNKLLNSFF